MQLFVHHFSFHSNHFLYPPGNPPGNLHSYLPGYLMLPDSYIYLTLPIIWSNKKFSESSGSLHLQSGILGLQCTQLFPPVILLGYTAQRPVIPPGYPARLSSPVIQPSYLPGYSSGYLMLTNLTNQFIKLSDGDLQCEWNSDIFWSDVKTFKRTYQYQDKGWSGTFEEWHSRFLPDFELIKGKKEIVNYVVVIRSNNVVYIQIQFVTCSTEISATQE